MVSELIKYGRFTTDSRLIYGNYGNLSARDEETIYTTKSGVILNGLSIDDFVHLADKISNNASSDSPIHLEIYKKYSCNAILHMHGDYTVLLSLNGKEIRPLDFVGKMFLERVPIVEGQFGTATLNN